MIYQKSFGKKDDDDCSGIPLSPREIQILKFVVAGKITKEIASDLGLSTHTVYTHRKNIMRKPIIAGNWKMNMTAADAVEFVNGIKDALDQIDGVDVAFCPTAIALLGVLWK